MITNAHAFQLGVLLASVNDPATALERFGVGPDFFEAMGYQHPAYGADFVLVEFSMAAKHRTRIARAARECGMEMPDIVRKALEAVCRDSLFGAILD